jgi:hypothetical protein
MNERILELADKAIEDMPGAWNIPDEFCEKFAELIVQEVTNIVLHYTDVDEGVSVAKKHFGLDK